MLGWYVMGIFGKKLLYVFVFLLLGGVIAASIYYFSRQQSSSLRISTKTLPVYSIPVQKILTYNNSVEQKIETPPHYAISGTVVIGSGDSRYGLEPTGSTGEVYYPLDITTVSLGSMYRFYDGKASRVPQVELLGVVDEMRLTYYADFSAGRAFGIIRRVERSGGNATVRFLDDPDDTRYAIATSLPLATNDPSQFFELNGRTIDDLAEGQILWLNFPPRSAKKGGIVNVNTVILRAPPTRMFRGVLQDVEVGSDSMAFRISGFPHQVRADKESLVYSYEDLPEMGVANYRARNLPLSTIQSGKRVVVYMYVAGDHWRALAVGLDPKER